MDRKPAQTHLEPASKNSLLAPIILTVSALAHCALLGYAALAPVVSEPEPTTARVQVQVYQHDDAKDAWSVLGKRWALVTRDAVHR